MVIDEHNSQTNIFVKGMDTDTSDIFLDTLRYREARNLRLSTGTDENQGELHIIEGTSLYTDTFNGLSIIKTDCVRDIVVVVTKNSGNWQVWKLNGTNKIPLTANINNPLGDKISTVLNYESDNNIFYYIADGINPIMKVDVNGNSLTYDDLISYLNKNLKPVGVSVTSGGLLKAGKILYTYRMYRLHSSVSQLSPISNVVKIYKDNTSGYKSEHISNKSVRLTFNNNVVGSHVLIFRIHYMQQNVPPVITMIYDDVLNQYNYTDRGHETADLLSLAEYISLTSIIMTKPKLILLKDNYLFAGNIQEYITTSLDYNDAISDIIQNPNSWFELELSFEEIDIRSYTSSRKNSFRYGETYKFGVILYDEYGNKTSVIPLNNVKINIETGNLYYYHDSTERIDKVKHINVTLKIRDNKTIPNLIKRIELVRAERNPSNIKTLTTGIVGGTFKLDTSNKFYPSYFLQMWGLRIGGGEGYKSDYTLLLFASPEIVYDHEFSSLLKSNISNLHCVINRYIPAVYEEENSVIKYRNKGVPIYHDSYYIIRPSDFLTKDNNNNFVNKQQSSYNENQYYNFNILEPQEQVLILDSLHKKDLSLKDIEFVEPPQWNKFSNGEQVRYRDDAIIIDNCEFIPWTTIMLDDLYGTVRYDRALSALKTGTYTGETTATIDNLYWERILCPISTTGKSALLRTNGATGLVTDIMVGATVYNSVVLADISRDDNDVLDYRDDVKYISFGDYIDTSNLRSVVSSAGDTYILIFEYNAAHIVQDSTYNYLSTASTVYRIPIQSYVDMTAEYGTSYSKQDEDYRILDTACAMPDYIQDKSCYLSDGIYNDTELVNISFTAPKDSSPITSNDTRIYASQKKESGEFIDSWLTFKAADFIDLSSEYGQITNMSVFKNNLIVWLKDATGIVSVNERALVNSVEDTQIMLGTAELLSRYDYITTQYGMAANQMCDAQSNSTLYWWDSYRRELLGYSGGQQVEPLTTTKNLRNYINNGVNNPSPYLVYDNLYKELLANVIGNESVVYNELQQCFTGIYDMYLKENYVHNDVTYLSTITGDIYALNKTLQDRISSREIAFVEHTPSGSDLGTYTDPLNMFTLTEEMHAHVEIEFGYITDIKLVSNGHELACPTGQDISYLPGFADFLQNSDGRFSIRYTVTARGQGRIVIYGLSLYVADTEVTIYGNAVYPKIKYVVNKNPQIVKVFDNIEFDGDFIEYKELSTINFITETPDSNLRFRFTTPLNQVGLKSTGITHREYSYRMAVPRNQEEIFTNVRYGQRLRGKTMLCELRSVSNSTYFAIKYITTKFRISWS